MSGQNKVSGVVLAGGMARRMGRLDKGLLPFHGRPLVSYAIAAMVPLVDELLISANRNQAHYATFGYPTISDENCHFDGPLAGILAAMQAAHHPLLLVMPCDSPLIQTEHLQRLLSNLDANVDIAVADDGARMHPVFAALKTHLQTDLKRYLQSGERKLQNWFNHQRLAKVDFSAEPTVFANINTPEELRTLESLESVKIA